MNLNYSDGQDEVPRNYYRLFHLVQDVVDRVPDLRAPGRYLKQLMADKLIAHKVIAHKQCIDQHGQDMPEIGNWNWSRSD